MATYTSDLTAKVLSACDAVTGWSELPAPHASGAAPAADTENYFHNAASISQATGQATGQGAGIQFDNGANLTWTATSNWCFFVWTFYAAPTNLVTWATGGMRVGIGSADNNAEIFNVGGNNFGTYPYGGWQNSCFDPEGTSDQTIGTPTAGQYQNFAVLPNITAKITKGSPLAVDVVRYGRGELKAIGTAADFSGMATFNDNATTGRYGLFALQSGSYLWKGLMSLGDSTNSVTFSDSNKLIRIEDTARVLAGFNKIEINNASSSVSWTSVFINGVLTSITGSAPVSPGDFEVIDNATVTLIGCNFTDMGTFIFNDGANPNTITDSVFRRCGLVTTGGAAFSGCVFDDTTDTTKAVLADTPTDAAEIDNSTFTSGGAGHGIQIGDGTAVITTQSITLTELEFSGYDIADPGTAANKAIWVNSGAGGGTVTLNISGGSGVTAATHVRATNCTVIVSADTTVTFTGMKDNTEVRIYKTSDNSVVGGIESATAGTTDNRTFAWSAASATDVYYVLHNWNALEPFYQTIRVEGYVVPSTDTSIAIQQQIDRNAE